MSQNQALIAELKMESATTRKLLACVPAEKNDYKPHDKSMALGRLASHVAELPGWITMTLQTPELDLLAREFKPLHNPTNEELLGLFDSCVAGAIAALENATDADFDAMWTLRRGEHVIMTLPKKVVLRSMAYSHMYHHRGQLSVYLRMLDIPIPGMYGPSADDTIAAKAAAALQAN